MNAQPMTDYAFWWNHLDPEQQHFIRQNLDKYPDIESDPIWKFPAEDAIARKAWAYKHIFRSMLDWPESKMR